MRALRAGTVAAVALGGGLAACGGGAKSPTVAALGNTPTTAAPSGSSQAGRLTVAQADAYAQCVRSHGVPNFPDPVVGPLGVPDFPDPNFSDPNFSDPNFSDPNCSDPNLSGGGVQIRLQGGPGSADQTKLHAAQNVCESELPGGFGGLGG